MSEVFLLPGLDEGPAALPAGGLVDVNAVGVVDINAVQIVAIA